MKAIINTFAKSDLAQFNGLTFDVVGHCKKHLEIEIGEFIFDIGVKEVIIIDIVNELRHASIRQEKTFCDYWYEMLRYYVKENKILLKLKEIPGTKFETVESDEIFSEIADEHII